MKKLELTEEELTQIRLEERNAWEELRKYETSAAYVEMNEKKNALTHTWYVLRKKVEAIEALTNTQPKP